MISFTWGGATHTGRVRSMNQDNLLANDGLFAVADGMGGHLGGEVASERSLDVLRNSNPSGLEALVDAVHAANLAVHTESAANPELRGMGTTLVAVVRTEDDQLALINVGDSRIYQYRSGTLKQLSEDHSLVESMVRRGQITAEAALTHPQRNVVLRALGVDADVDLDAWTLRPVDGDRLVLCSDGLFNEVSGDQIAGILAGHPDPQAAAERLVEAANEGGGRDNITVIVVDVQATPDDTPVEERLTQVLFADQAIATHEDDTTREVAVPVGARPPEEPDDPLPPAPAAGDVAPTNAPDQGDVDPAHAGEVDDPPSRSVVRTMAFLTAIVLTFGVALAGVGLWGRMSWFVAISDTEQVTVYQGRPGGFLWFQPTVIDQTALRTDDLEQADLLELDPGKIFSGRAAAETYVANLNQRARDRATTTTRATTTQQPKVGATAKPKPVTTKSPATARPQTAPQAPATTAKKANSLRSPPNRPAPGALPSGGP